MGHGVGSSRRRSIRRATERSLSEGKLEQRRLLGYRRYSISDIGVEVEERSPLSQTKFTVEFPAIGDSRIEATTSASINWLVSAATLLTVSVIGSFVAIQRDDTADSYVMLALFGLAAFCALVYFMSRQSWIGYASQSEPLVFWKDRPSPEELSSFLRAIEQRRDAYLADGAGSAARASVIDALERLAALKQQGMISEAEFQCLKEEAMRQVPARGQAEDRGTYL